MAEDSLRNLQPGTIVNGRYEVVKGLGAGSMGMVYACRHRELGGRLVAMKVLFPEVAADRIAAQRFRNEIYASYEVNHPNVVRAYEYFVDGDIVAYTMEYVGGGDLAELISADEPIPIPDIVKMLSQMCCGVQTIHSAGIIHRDLKPENILLSSQGDIKITDFGIARCGAGPKLTEHGGVVGTIDYVSPEYLELGQVDTRSDIYALGVLGYEMITGRTPFKGGSVIETMTLRLRTDPESPGNKRAGCPQELSAIVLRAMMRNPDERYQTADEMLRDLDHVRDNLAEMMKNVELQERRPSAPTPTNRFVGGSQRNSAYPAPEGTQNYLPVKGGANTYNGPSYRPGSGSRTVPPMEPTASSNRLRAQVPSAPVPIPMSRSATEMARPAEPLLSMVSDQEMYYEDEGGGSFIVQFLFWLVVIMLGLIVGVVLVYAVSGGNADQFPVLQKVFRIMDIIRQ